MESAVCKQDLSDSIIPDTPECDRSRSKRQRLQERRSKIHNDWKVKQKFKELQICRGFENNSQDSSTKPETKDFCENKANKISVDQSLVHKPDKIFESEFIKYNSKSTGSVPCKNNGAEMLNTLGTLVKLEQGCNKEITPLSTKISPDRKVKAHSEKEHISLKHPSSSPHSAAMKDVYERSHPHTHKNILNGNNLASDLYMSSATYLHHLKHNTSRISSATAFPNDVGKNCVSVAESKAQICKTTEPITNGAISKMCKKETNIIPKGQSETSLLKSKEHNSDVMKCKFNGDLSHESNFIPKLKDSSRCRKRKQQHHKSPLSIKEIKSSEIAPVHLPEGRTVKDRALKQSSPEHVNVLPQPADAFACRLEEECMQGKHQQTGRLCRVSHTKSRHVGSTSSQQKCKLKPFTKNKKSLAAAVATSTGNTKFAPVAVESPWRHTRVMALSRGDSEDFTTESRIGK